MKTRKLFNGTHFGVNVVNRNITQLFQSEKYTHTHKLLFHSYIFQVFKKSGDSNLNINGINILMCIY